MLDILSASELWGDRTACILYFSWPVAPETSFQCLSHPGLESRGAVWHIALAPDRRARAAPLAAYHYYRATHLFASKGRISRSWLHIVGAVCTCINEPGQHWYPQIASSAHLLEPPRCSRRTQSCRQVRGTHARCWCTGKWPPRKFSSDYLLKAPMFQPGCLLPAHALSSIRDLCWAALKGTK